MKCYGSVGGEWQQQGNASWDREIGWMYSLTMVFSNVHAGAFDVTVRLLTPHFSTDAPPLHCQYRPALGLGGGSTPGPTPSPTPTPIPASDSDSDSESGSDKIGVQYVVPIGYVRFEGITPQCVLVNEAATLTDDEDRDLVLAASKQVWTGDGRTRLGMRQAQQTGRRARKSVCIGEGSFPGRLLE